MPERGTGRGGRDRTACRRLVRLVAVVGFVCALTTASGASAITRASILARAQSWIDARVPYSQTHYYHGYRTDCSGFTSMCWMLRSGGHPLSLSTRTLHDVSHWIAAEQLKPGDCLLREGHHARIFYGWVDATHTLYVCYEQTGPIMKSSIRSLADDLGYGYRPARYDHVTDGPPAWNLAVNPTFDVWASGAPVWWTASGGSAPASEICSRSADSVKTSKSALRLINPSSRVGSVVAASQTSNVTTGVPYALSAWVSADAPASAFELRLRFLDANGAVLLTTSTTGVAWSVETTRLVQMSVFATAPADAASATISVRLAGGSRNTTDVAGTMAVVDDVWFYDRSPVTSSIAVSTTSVARHHHLSVSGRVTAPIAYGAVRIYVTRPGSRTASAWQDRPLVNGVWSASLHPGYRGTYTFTAKYLGYGPWGPVSSPRVSVKVR
jgi:hypothetical protein